MSYKIQYGKSLKQERTVITTRFISYPVLKWAIFSVIAITIAILGRIGMLDFMIPGDREVTKAAFQTMVREVRDGDSVKEAVAAFCEEIIAGADYAD